MPSLLKRPRLVDAQDMARRFPDTFEVPSAEALAAVGPGRLVKVALASRGERFWVEVVARRGDGRLEGLVRNRLVSSRSLLFGDRIAFRESNVYQVSPRAARRPRLRLPGSCAIM